MSIDWMTVAAQIANFLVLVWLLKRFLYRPILDGIDAREAEIAARMGEAATIRTAAEAAEAAHKAEIAALGASRADLLNEARASAEADRSALLAEAREAIAAEQADRSAARAEEARAFTADLHRKGAEALVALARKALSDLADETLEQRIATHLAPKIATVAYNLRDATESGREAVALTRTPLPHATEVKLGKDLAATLNGIPLRFDTDPQLAPGLTLRVGGAEVAWTVESYLDGLEALLTKGVNGSARREQTDAA
jgi:F-type H+-transporting ATPase subunit b